MADDQEQIEAQFTSDPKGREGKKEKKPDVFGLGDFKGENEQSAKVRESGLDLEDKEQLRELLLDLEIAYEDNEEAETEQILKEVREKTAGFTDDDWQRFIEASKIKTPGIIARTLVRARDTGISSAKSVGKTGGRIGALMLSDALRKTWKGTKLQVANLWYFASGQHNKIKKFGESFNEMMKDDTKKK